MWKIVVSMVAVASLVPSHVTGETVAPRTVTIRIYNGFGVPLSLLADARATADTILMAGGTVPVWRMCRTPSGPSADERDRCDDVLRSVELAVRLVRAPTAGVGRYLPFGHSHVDEESRLATLSTVFADRVNAAVRRLGIDGGALLGRVIAHEVGHLLLGSSSHSLDGLMRAEWHDGLLRRGARQDWLFSESESRLMQDAWFARLHGMPIPVVDLARAGRQPTAVPR